MDILKPFDTFSNTSKEPLTWAFPSPHNPMQLSNHLLNIPSTQLNFFPSAIQIRDPKINQFQNPETNRNYSNSGKVVLFPDSSFGLVVLSTGNPNANPSPPVVPPKLKSTPSTNVPKQFNTSQISCKTSTSWTCSQMVPSPLKTITRPPYNGLIT